VPSPPTQPEPTDAPTLEDRTAAVAEKALLLAFGVQGRALELRPLSPALSALAELGYVALEGIGDDGRRSFSLTLAGAEVVIELRLALLGTAASVFKVLEVLEGFSLEAPPGPMSRRRAGSLLALLFDDRGGAARAKSYR
jgi:hypothetical protein